MERAILPGDTLANDAGVLIDENGGRRRRRCEAAMLLELLRAKQPRRQGADQSRCLAGHRSDSLLGFPDLSRDRSILLTSRLESGFWAVTDGVKAEAGEEQRKCPWALGFKGGKICN